MPTIKEKLDHVKQLITANRQLAEALENTANHHHIAIAEALYYQLNTTTTIDGYTISIIAETKSPKHPDRYTITIKEPMTTQRAICHFKAFFTLTDGDIVCDINHDSQRLDHRQIEDYITKAFGF